MVIELDTTGHLPLYSDNWTINESFYFEGFDNYNNYFYFDQQLIANNVSEGFYNITFDPYYSMEFYHTSQGVDEGNLTILVNTFNPYPLNNTYLNVLWSDQYAWNEWHLIETPNINASTLEVYFDHYDEATEEYETITYNVTDNFTTRQVAMEYLYPYNAESSVWDFELSQNYSDAVDLGILSIEGYYFNESSISFEITDGEIIGDNDEIIRITAPAGFGNLDQLALIVVMINFSSGAYSDFTQFKMLEEDTLWTKNDSIWVEYEYNDIDYFILFEDYLVGGDDSYFEHIEYIRNEDYIDYDGSTFTMNYQSHEEIFENFTYVNDMKSAIDLTDFDMNSEFEKIVKKDDLTANGMYDSLAYGYENAAGEISYSTQVVTLESYQSTSDRSYDFKGTDWYCMYDANREFWRAYDMYACRGIESTSTVTKSQTRNLYYITEDINEDGTFDRDTILETIFTIVEINSFSVEYTSLKFKSAFGSDFAISRALQSTTNSQSFDFESSVSFTFRDLEGGKPLSTRVYEDKFPNEITEVNNINKYGISIENTQGDTDPLNDLIAEVPLLGSLLSRTHITDKVSEIFESSTIIEDGEVSTSNILAVNKSLTLEGKSVIVNAIEVKPKAGVYYDNNMGLTPHTSEGGKYLYINSGNPNNVYDTILILDSQDSLIGVGFDYDNDKIFLPNKRVPTLKKTIIKKQLSDYGSVDASGSYSGKGYLRYLIELVSSGDDEGLLYARDGGSKFTLEKTFSDSLFEFWKLSFEGASSPLIREASEYTADRYMEMLTIDQLNEDVGFQIFAMYTATAVGGALALKVTGSLVSGPAGWVMLGGYFVTYFAITVIKGMIDTFEQEQKQISQEFHSSAYMGETTLSSAPKFDQDINVNWNKDVEDSIHGVYSMVYKEDSDYSYEGQVVLAPNAVKKTRDYGSSFIDLGASYYSVQTRGYAGFSDTSIFRHGFEEIMDYDNNEFDYSSGSDSDSDRFDILYSQNNIMYLEDKVSSESGGRYERIIPTMYYGAPILDFADIGEGVPLPEFYEDYPFLVESGIPQNDYHYIYRGYYPGQSLAFPIIPAYSEHELNSDVVKINIWDPKIERQLGVIGRENFTVDVDAKTLTLDSSELVDFPLLSSYGWMPYVVLEICVEKYRIISDTPTEEENTIVAMQSIQANIMKYLYQFQIAQQTESTIQEIAYTNRVTIISTLWNAPVMIATAGISLGKDLGFGKAIGELTTKIALKKIIQTGTVTALSLVSAVIGECLEEVYLDPYVGQIGIEVFASMGLTGPVAELVGSSLFESGRETVGSAASSLRSAFKSIKVNKVIRKLGVNQELQANIKHTLEYDGQNSLSTVDFVKLGIKSMVLGMTLGPAGIGLALASDVDMIAQISVNTYNRKVALKEMREARELLQIRSDVNRLSHLLTVNEYNRWLSEQVSSESFVLKEGILVDSHLEFLHQISKHKSYDEMQAYMWCAGGMGARQVDAGVGKADISSLISANNLMNSLEDLTLEEAEEYGISSSAMLEGIKAYMEYKAGIFEFNKISTQGYLEWYVRERDNYFSERFRSLKLDKSIACFSLEEVKTLFADHAREDYYGLIYKITRIKDEFGNKIDNGEVRIGQTERGIMKRFRSYFLEARSKKRRGEYMSVYMEDMLKYGEDAYKIEIIQICESEAEYNIAEEFWTLFYNKRDNTFGFNLDQNNFFNPIVGDYFSKWNRGGRDNMASGDRATLAAEILKSKSLRASDFSRVFKELAADFNPSTSGIFWTNKFGVDITASEVALCLEYFYSDLERITGKEVTIQEVYKMFLRERYIMLIKNGFTTKGDMITQFGLDKYDDADRALNTLQLYIFKDTRKFSETRNNILHDIYNNPIKKGIRGFQKYFALSSKSSVVSIRNTLIKSGFIQELKFGRNSRLYPINQRITDVIRQREWILSKAYGESVLTTLASHPAITVTKLSSYLDSNTKTIKSVLEKLVEWDIVNHYYVPDDTLSGKNLYCLNPHSPYFLDTKI